MKKYFLILPTIIALILIANPGIAAKITLKPVKPTSNIAVSDEQQGILAVRSAKVSVVNIVGQASATISFGQSADLEETVSGTGFIVDSGGYIVSNNHVIQDSNLKYTVVFADGTQYEAKVVGLDKYDDIGLLKIEAAGLPVAKLGDSDTLETGQSVFTIGNSLGKYQNTVTRGVVSGLGRSLSVGDDTNPLPRMQKLIQTDASINPGNSGGPLINMAGEVVGMNTLIDRSGESVGFAVPVNTIKDAISQLRMFGKVSRPFMGISFSTLNRATAANYSTSIKQGAIIASVIKGSPAGAAGILPGDIITEINGDKLTEQNELDRVIGKFRAGDQVLVTLYRGSEKMEFTLVLAEYK
jgi:serine protease Do